MGHGGKYSPHEAHVIALAWKIATYTEKGTDQRVESFINDFFKVVEANAPPNTTPGTYHYRQPRQLYHHWRDVVSRDINLFNKSIRIVNSSQPTGVDDQQKINIAVAIHMKKTAKMDYAYKDFEPKQWRHYAAWLNVKDTPKFKYNYPTTVALTPAARTVGFNE
jgi:hypothetical protein